MWRVRLYLCCKYAKFIGIIALALTLFSDLIIFKWLCLFAVAAVIEIGLSFSTLKCSIQQIIGMSIIKRKYGNNIPSYEDYKSDIEYSLPFEGEWTVINGCFTKEFSHSWDIPTQRYAYDFIMLDEEGKSYSGNSKQVNAYYCYNREILAPADGIVIKVEKNAKDTIILGNGRFFNRASHIAGNYIVIKHSDNEFSTLAHLKEDSIVVHVGDKVARGQKLATCGNTGNSSEPHLHFQLQNGVDFYNSLGLPVRFNNVIVSIPLNYDKIDPRPRMEVDKIPKGLITRGYNVLNNTM